MKEVETENPILECGFVEGIIEFYLYDDGTMTVCVDGMTEGAIRDAIAELESRLPEAKPAGPEYLC